MKYSNKNMVEIKVINVKMLKNVPCFIVFLVLSKDNSYFLFNLSYLFLSRIRINRSYNKKGSEWKWYGYQ